MRTVKLKAKVVVASVFALMQADVVLADSGGDAFTNHPFVMNVPVELRKPLVVKVRVLINGFVEEDDSRAAKFMASVLEKTGIDLDAEIRTAFGCSLDPGAETFCSQIIVVPKQGGMNAALKESGLEKCLTSFVWVEANIHGFSLNVSVDRFPPSYGALLAPAFNVSYLVPPESEMFPPVEWPARRSKDVVEKLVYHYWLSGSPVRAEAALRSGLREIRPLITTAMSTNVLEETRAAHYMLLELPSMKAAEKAGIASCHPVVCIMSTFWYADAQRLLYWQRSIYTPTEWTLRSMPNGKPTP